MSMAKRERTLLIATAAVLGLLVVDRYVLTPFFDERDALDTQRDRITLDITRDQKLIMERKELSPKWKTMVKGGLQGDPAEAEGQLLHAIRDWAKESGMTLSSVKPERPESKEQLKEIRVLATGTGTMDNMSRFLMKIHGAPFPLKITEFQLGSRTDGNNDLSIQVKVSTLYCPPEQKVAASEQSGNGGAR